MGITVFYGIDKAALEKRNKLVISHTDINTIMIVPEQFSLSAEQNYSDVNKINFEVLSFRRLCKKIFEAAGKITGGYVSRAAKIMIMHKVIDSVSDKLLIYGNSSKKSGFAASMAKNVAEFKHASVLPETVLEKAESTEGYIRDKLKDFATLYNGFNTMVEKTGRDSDDDLTYALELLSKNPGLYGISGSCIMINNFNGFTAQEKKLIKLFSKVADVYISVLSDSMDDDVAICFSSTVNNIKKLTEDTSANFVYTEPDGNESAPELLASNYFRYSSDAYKTNDIFINYGKNSFYEISGVASEIIRLCREEGYRFRDIAVVYRNPDIYCSLIRRIFDMFGIAHFLDYREPISENPFIAFVYAVSDVLEFNFSYDSVINLIKSVFSPVPRDDADVFENFVLEYGITGRYLTDDELWQNRTEKLSGKSGFKKICYVRTLVITPLVRFKKKVSGISSYREHAKSLFELICDFDVFGSLKKLTDEMVLRGELRSSEVYSRIWNVFIGMLDEIVDISGDSEGTFLKFMSVFKAGLDDATAGVIPPVADCVTVSDGQRFVGGKIKALFAIGVNNGEFPGSGNLSGIFDGSDREIIESLGIDLTTNRITAAIAEQEILYKIFSAPEKRIYFSYRTTNLNGEAVAPSEVINRVRDIFPDISVSEFTVTASAPAYTFEHILAAKEIDNSDYANSYTWFSQNPEWNNKIATLNYNKPSNTIRLSEETVEKLHENGFKGSISQLECYARCPFSYFAKYNLRIKPRKVFRIGAPDIGTLVHNVLEYSAIEIDKSTGWDNVSKDACEDVVKKAVAETAPEFLNGLMMSSPRYRYTLSKLTKLMSKNLYYIARQFSHSKFRPSGYEITFGEGCEEGPIILTSGNGKKITLTGKIDRCDVLKKDGVDYIRIIDYKTGNKELKLSDVYNGLNLQLLTYLDAVCGNDRKPAGVLYFKVEDKYIAQNELKDTQTPDALIKDNYKMQGLVLNNGDILMDMDDELKSINVSCKNEFKGDIATEAELDILRHGVKQSIRKLSDGILSGNIDSTPVNGTTHGPCVYCDYKNVCRTTSGFRKTAKFSNNNEVYEKMKEEQSNE